MDENKKQKIIRAIKEKNMPPKEVAAKLFMSEKQLKLLLESWGIEISKKRKSFTKVPPPERRALMTIYEKYGNTQKVGEYYSVGVNTVNRWMKAMKIPTRKMKLSKEDKVKFLEEHLGRLDNINV